MSRYVPSESISPAGSCWFALPFSGRKDTVPVVSGWPSTVTLPTTGTSLLPESPQPITVATFAHTPTTRRYRQADFDLKSDKSLPPFAGPANRVGWGERRH